MHRACYLWVERVVRTHDLSGGFFVLELGAANVNGTIRPLFDGYRKYIGIDLRPGVGVDVVADARDYTAPVQADVIVSCEMLEHCPEPWRVITNAYRNLRSGGAFLLTAAGVERAPHGNDGLDPGDEYYAGIDSRDLATWLDAAGFVDYTIERNPAAGDIYCVAFRTRRDA